MKVAVYAIALNEAKHAARWAEATRDADVRLVVDTGSSDSTIPILKAHGVEVVRAAVHPWRFDVARNVALSLVPADVDWCIVLDLDEVLDAGWRDKLTDEGTRKWCVYHWSPEVTFLDDRRIHRRFGYQWRFACHEEIYASLGAGDTLVSSDVSISHLPDPGKSRAQYLELLAHAYEECRDMRSVGYGDRMRTYYARELGYYGRREEAAAVLAGGEAWP